MVINEMKNECRAFDTNKYLTPLLKKLREKSRKRTVLDAFGETTSALDHLELSPTVKRVLRRPPPVLTVYVRRETEKAYNAIFMESVTVENFKEALSLCYGLQVTSIKHVTLRAKSGDDMELDEQCLKSFVDEDDFLLTLDYDDVHGTCNVTLAEC